MKTLENREEILDRLVRFKKDIFDQSISNGHLSVLAEKFARHAIFIVSADGGEETGYISFYCNDTESRTAFVSMIIVGSAYRGHGYGRRLIEEAQRVSKENGMRSLLLEVSRYNAAALRFYERMGFGKVAEKGNQLILSKAL